MTNLTEETVHAEARATEAMDAKIDAMIAKVCSDPGKIAEGTVRLLRPLLAELVERREHDRWIPVGERLPEWDGVKDYEKVWAYSPAYGEYILGADSYWIGPCAAVFDGVRFYSLSGTLMVDVTHWRPLPEVIETRERTEAK